MLDLKKWAMNYFKYRSNFEKFRLNDKEEIIELEFKDYKENVYFNKKLQNTKLQKGIIVTENSLVNRNFLVNNWNKFLVPEMKIFFVNKDESKWAINPKVHDKFTDNIKKSIIALSKNSK